MRKPDTIKYDWPETGRPEILMHGSHSATLRYMSPEAAIKEGLAKAAKWPARAENSEASTNIPRRTKSFYYGRYFDFTDTLGLHNNGAGRYNNGRRPLNHEKPPFDNREVYMQTSNNDEFARLSDRCMMPMKARMLDWFAYDLKSMGALLGLQRG